MSNPYKWRAIARNRKRAEFDDDNPRTMAAKFPGICDHCGRPISAGEQMQYSYATRKCWHVECWPKRKDSSTANATENETKANTPQPQEEQNSDQVNEPAHVPAPQTTPPWTRLNYRNGTVDISAYCNGLITWDGKAVFLSIIGTDSTVKGIGAAFLNQKGSSSRYSWRNGLFYEENYGNDRPIFKVPDGTYHRHTTKLGNGTQQILALNSFFPDGPNMEVDYRYLLYKPDGTGDPSSLIFNHIIDHMPTPYLPEWSQAIFTGLRVNAKHYQTKTAPDAEDLARVDLLDPQIGPWHAARIRVTEKSMDALISQLVSMGIVEF